MTDQGKWKAVLANESRVDGCFFYAVQTTGIFCRPSCRSKPPLEKNVSFFDTAKEAQLAGFRPCKRCRPDLPVFKPEREMAEKIQKTVEREFQNKTLLNASLKALGLSKHRLSEIFKENYQMTLGEYVNSLRFEKVEVSLKNSDLPIGELAYSQEFESLSAFYRFCGRYAKTSPGRWRKNLKEQKNDIHA